MSQSVDKTGSEHQKRLEEESVGFVRYTCSPKRWYPPPKHPNVLVGTLLLAFGWGFVRDGFAASFGLPQSETAPASGCGLCAWSRTLGVTCCQRLVHENRSGSFPERVLNWLPSQVSPQIHDCLLPMLALLGVAARF